MYVYVYVYVCDTSKMTTTSPVPREPHGANGTISSPVHASTSAPDTGASTAARPDTTSMTTTVVANGSAGIRTTTTAAQTPMPTQVSQEKISIIIDPTVEQDVKLLRNGKVQGVHIPAMAYVLDSPISVQIVLNDAILDTATTDVDKTKVSDILKLEPSGSVFQSPVIVSIVADSLPGAGRRLALFKLDENTQQWHEQQNSITNTSTAVVSVETMSFSYWTVFEVDNMVPTTQPHTTPLVMLPKPASRSTDDTVYILIPAIIGFALFSLIVVCVCYPTLHSKSRLLFWLGYTPRAEWVDQTPRTVWVDHTSRAEWVDQSPRSRSSQEHQYAYTPPISSTYSSEQTLPTTPSFHHRSHNNSFVSPIYNSYNHNQHPPATQDWHSNDGDSPNQNSMFAWRQRNP